MNTSHCELLIYLRAWPRVHDTTHAHTTESVEMHESINKVPLSSPSRRFPSRFWGIFSQWGQLLHIHGRMCCQRAEEKKHRPITWSNMCARGVGLWQWLWQARGNATFLPNHCVHREFASCVCWDYREGNTRLFSMEGLYVAPQASLHNEKGRIASRDPLEKRSPYHKIYPRCWTLLEIGQRWGLLLGIRVSRNTPTFKKYSKSTQCCARFGCD